MRILVVEDEPKVADALREGLESEQYEVVVERTGEGAFFRIATERFDLVVLDLGLPGRDGLEILTNVREQRITVPVLILTARDTVSDRVAGLDAGADEYLVKPFAFAELLARLRALSRRSVPGEVSQVTVGPLLLDRTTRRVTHSNEKVDLTVREFELLECLMRYSGQVVSRDTLARDVWKEAVRTTSLDNVIDVYIARLRRKVEADGPIRLIHTVRGVGFMVRAGEP